MKKLLFIGMLSAWSMTFSASDVQKIRDKAVVKNFLLAAQGKQVNPLAFSEISDENRAFVQESLILDKAASWFGTQFFENEQFRDEFLAYGFKKKDFLRYLKVTLFERKDFDVERALTGL